VGPDDGAGADRAAVSPDARAGVDVDRAVADAFRREWGQVVATLIGVTGDWDLAEECAQEAFARALPAWRRDGLPRSPGAWLTTAARNPATDRLRRRSVGATKLDDAATLGRRRPGEEAADPLADAQAGLDAAADDAASGVVDDRLRLMFTCCHPALPLEGRVALTLRTLAGLTTAEIGRAFLVPEATMSQRLVRAKRKIRHAGIPYRVPPAHLLPGRTAGVLAVLYLLFNEGYTASSGTDLVRHQLTAEAIRLARVLDDLMPDDSEVGGLLALLLLHDARRAARLDDAGDLVTLDVQDRSRWDRSQIAEGLAVLDTATATASPDEAGPYLLQAAIAACHAGAAQANETDWARIAALYTALARAAPSAVVALNRAVAVGMAEGPAAGLAAVDEIESAGALAGYHLLPATRADLLRRAGDLEAAAAAYRQALPLAPTEAEQRYLARRLAEVTTRR
jgi:RNA polymerase sigma-70 factor, ECF subfamily